MGYLDNSGLSYLWGKIKTALGGKQNKLSGTKGQVVGFDAEGNAQAQDAPASGITQEEADARYLIRNDGGTVSGPVAFMEKSNFYGSAVFSAEAAFNGNVLVPTEPTQDSNPVSLSYFNQILQEQKLKAYPITLVTSAWSSNSQTITVPGVLADETKQLIQPVPAIASQAAYLAAGILCTGQAANSLTFTCQTVPEADLTVYIVITDVKSTEPPAPTAHIYGAEWDGSAATTWTRTDEAAGFGNPSPAVNNGNGSSPFDNLMPWSGMVIEEDAVAGTLVKIPKYWYKWTKSGNSLKLQIADKETDGFHVSPAHADRGDGKGERDIVYVGRYHCNTNNYKSQSGVKPKANITRSAARTSIHNLGSNIWQSDIQMRMTIWMLYLVEFADWNSQKTIGKGCGNNSATENMGYTDSMPYHTGTTLASRDSYGLGTQYRYIEGLWDNVYDWGDGCYYNSNGLNIINTPSSFSDNSGGTAVGVPSSGWPSAFTVATVAGLEWVIYPTASGGSETTYSADYWDFNAANPCLCFGGGYNQYGNYGLFFVSYTSASNSSANIGCRLQKLP